MQLAVALAAALAVALAAAKLQGCTCAGEPLKDTLLKAKMKIG